VDSIRDVEVVEVGETGKLIAREETEMSLIRLRKASELEQQVRVQTGNPEKPLFPHPDGLKKDGDDICIRKGLHEGSENEARPSPSELYQDIAPSAATRR
jgi:hypothetical protein